MCIVGMSFFMQTLDTTIVNTALPSMAQGLHESPLAMQPVVVAYTLTMAMLTPASGWVADRFGLRKTFFVTILLFVLGSAWCASAQSLQQLVAARVLQGIGGSMLLPLGRLTLLKSVPTERYIAALAATSIAGQFGQLIGPTLGGALSQWVTWHWIFLINLPIGVVGLWAVQRFVPDKRVHDVGRFDFLGFALLSTCMVAFSLALDVPVTAHRGAWAVGLLGASVLTALVYIPHARRRPMPLFRLGLFREPNFTPGLIGNLISRLGSAAVPFLLPLLMQLQMGYTPLYSGLMMVPAALSGLMAKSWVGRLVGRYGFDKFLLVNTLVVGGSIVSFALISPQWPLWIQIVQLMVFGAANSMQFAAMNAVTLGGLPRADAGSGNSLFSMAQMLAMGLGVTVGGGLLNLFSASMATGTAFRLTFVTVGVITLLSAAVFRSIQDVRPHARPATTTAPVRPGAAAR
ncbi:MAG: MFS transporter [Pseudomonadota bacterium]